MPSSRLPTVKPVSAVSSQISPAKIAKVRYCTLAWFLSPSTAKAIRAAITQSIISEPSRLATPATDLGPDWGSPNRCPGYALAAPADVPGACFPPAGLFRAWLLPAGVPPAGLLPPGLPPAGLLPPDWPPAGLPRAGLPAAGFPATCRSATHPKVPPANISPTRPPPVPQPVTWAKHRGYGSEIGG